MKDKPDFPLVYVQWVDSVGAGACWGSIPEKTPSVHGCHSVGWLVCENDEVLVLVPHLSLEDEDYAKDEIHGCGDMTIPKVAVVKKVELRYKISIRQMTSQ